MSKLCFELGFFPEVIQTSAHLGSLAVHVLGDISCSLSSATPGPIDHSRTTCALVFGRQDCRHRPISNSTRLNPLQGKGAVQYFSSHTSQPFKILQVGAGIGLRATHQVPITHAGPVHSTALIHAMPTTTIVL